jgi:hypothetical protein
MIQLPPNHTIKIQLDWPQGFACAAILVRITLRLGCEQRGA